jgi:hypothetical protein
LSWLNIDTFLEHGELGIMTMVILLATFLIYRAMRELGKREDRAIQVMVNNTKAMQGVIGMAEEIKRAVGYCPRRLKIELEQIEAETGILNIMDEGNEDEPEPE